MRGPDPEDEDEGEDEDEAMMREAIAEYFPETRLVLVDDLLAEPDED